MGNLQSLPCCVAMLDVYICRGTGMPSEGQLLARMQAFLACCAWAAPETFICMCCAGVHCGLGVQISQLGILC